MAALDDSVVAMTPNLFNWISKEEDEAENYTQRLL